MFSRGYSVDTIGNLYNPKGIKVTGCVHNNNRRYTCYRIEGKRKNVPFHRLVAYAKYGDSIYDDKIVVRHLDSNPLNNSWNNIAIGTQHDNMMDIDENERKKHASVANKKYSDDLVREIREKHRNGMPYTEIMNKYHISSKGTLSFIINKRMFI